ncbi:MAG: 2-C-methyl-D-erythritol 2,4-cyclodiphosphate synthase [Bacteroidales bacterium]|nr:2-C-methyl-D-erythritol 2,4-cyclodiphosphate synthase [Bacteroidales bacterium]
MDFKIGNGYDVHALAPGLPMWLGGVQIPSDRGFVAHSDGDVAIHALCDAILGALALGDIGHLFPDTDPAWKGIDSKLLLGKVVSLMTGKGYRLGNADITIALQAPKLAPHILRMRETLAPILGVGIDCVSVKATTTEHLGFVGRGEGCSVQASVLLLKNM